MIVFSVCPSADRKARPLRMSSCGDVPGAPAPEPERVVVVAGRVGEEASAGRRRARHDRSRRRVVRRREAAREVLHDLRDLGRPPAGRVVVARLRRIRLVVADRDVVEVAAAGRLRELVDLVVREAEALRLCAAAWIRVQTPSQSGEERLVPAPCWSAPLSSLIARPLPVTDVARDRGDVRRRAAERAGRACDRHVRVAVRVERAVRRRDAGLVAAGRLARRVAAAGVRPGRLVEALLRRVAVAVQDGAADRDRPRADRRPVRGRGRPASRRRSSSRAPGCR